MSVLKKHRFLLTVCVGLTAGIATKVYFEERAHDQINSFQENFIYEAAREINTKSPAMVDDQTRLDGAEALSNRKLLITYSLPETKAVDLDISMFTSMVRPKTEAAFCEFIGKIPGAKGDYIFSYKYKDVEGKTITTIDAKSEVCK